MPPLSRHTQPKYTPSHNSQDSYPIKASAQSPESYMSFKLDVDETEPVKQKRLS